ncbi:MAG TPA: glutamine--fructose-6-phosphate transaminase (isomerizing) [Lachnospiraceae bacterium]|nr:glutamine--fructose-6-phosphate transaminase (isomerizing) [Lachnospiraceae bacterium]
MCGIVGYIGEEQAGPILLDGLSKLEYRGYDSAGIAVFDGEKINTHKALGKLRVLYDETEGGNTLKGTCGIGHTRWATHGIPSVRNAHPHMNSDETIAVVHNGIIENYLKLRKKLEGKGYVFNSDTDTEVVAHLLDYYYKGDALKAIATVMQRVEGSYALAILFKDHPSHIYAARKDSPMVIGKGSGENYVASDVPAILRYTRDVFYVENEELVSISKENVRFYNTDLEEVSKECKKVEWDISAAEKGGYEYFMLKEIYDQPKAIKDTMNPRIKDDNIVIEELGMTDEEIRRIDRIYIVACGTAYHTGVAAKYIFEDLARIPVEVDLASEFRYRNPICNAGTMVIVVSQSGETADSLAALRLAKERGLRTLGIVNVVGSSIAREADHVIYTWAGPEIAVASTKAYSTQLIAHYLLAVKFAFVRGMISREEMSGYIREMKELPAQIEMLLAGKEKIQKFANRYIAAKDVFFIGRGLDYAVSLEASLKLKEISYIFSDAYAAGELKHGPISLVEDGTLVVAVLTQDVLVPKMISNMQEVITRGAFVMAITNTEHTEVEKSAQYVLYIPKTCRYFTCSLAIIPLQLFAYYISLGKGLDVDKPRNLAKSVTVE